VILSYIATKVPAPCVSTGNDLLEAGVASCRLPCSHGDGIVFLCFAPSKRCLSTRVILNSTPIVAIAAPIRIIFGSGMWSKVITAIICVFFPVLGPYLGSGLCGFHGAQNGWTPILLGLAEILVSPASLCASTDVCQFQGRMERPSSGPSSVRCLEPTKGWGFDRHAIYIMTTPGSFRASLPALCWALLRGGHHGR